MKSPKRNHRSLLIVTLDNNLNFSAFLSETVKVDTEEQTDQNACYRKHNFQI